MLRRNCLAALVVAFTVALPQAARAVVFVNDTWKDDTDSDPASPAFSENGTDVDGDGDIESLWIKGGIGDLEPVAGVPAGPLRGDLMGGGTGTTSASWTTYFTPEGSEVNLANPGDALKVTWKFTLTGVNTGNTSQGLRFAVVDSDARAIANGSLPATANYLGYAVFGNMGPTLNSSSSFQLRERSVATTGKLLENSSDYAVLANGGTRNNTGYVAATEYTMTWLMTHNGANLDFDVSISGGLIDNSGLLQVTFSDTTPTTFKFDTFAIRPSQEVQTASIFDTSLFKVELLSAGGGSENANFDGVGVTDGNDYLIWQRGLGATGTGTLATGDANGDTNVNGADLGIWRNHFGAAAVAAAGAVPEPSSLACGLLAVAGLASLRRRKY